MFYPAPESPKLLLRDGGAKPKAFGAGFRSAPHQRRSHQLLLAELHLQIMGVFACLGNNIADAF